MVDDSFGFNNAANENVKRVVAICDGSYDLAVIKSGKGLSAATVFVDGSNAALLKYNEEHGTNYIGLPKDCYSLNTNSISYSASEVSKTVTVSWNLEKIMNEMAYEPLNDYVIPIAIKSDDLEVNEGRNLVLISLKSPKVVMGSSLVNWSVVYGENAVAIQETKNVNVVLDMASSKDLEVTFEVAEELLESYNITNGVMYEAAPEGLISFSNTVTIKRGELQAQLPVTVNTSVLIDENGAIPEYSGYVVPVRVKAVSEDGVEYMNAITYVVVSYPRFFERLWGIYATSATSPWQATFGLSDCRNITMDDQFIYIPQSAGGDPVLRAVSITDPTQMKNVNVEGISSGTHTLSCVRMIPNTDSEINGGKDILVASNLTLGSEAHANYYVWLNGIDNAPTKYMVDDSGRRMGDKFTVVGSWKNGELYIKDYNTGNIVRNAMIVDGDGFARIGEWPAANNGLSYARGRFDYSESVSDAAGCIGAAYVYPGVAINEGVPATTEFLVTSTSSAHLVNNTSGAWASVLDLNNSMTHGYNFFSDATTGKKFIAYVDIETNQAQGNVKVIHDFNGTAAGFAEVLQEQKVVFEAPIQDAMNKAALSPCPATHSTGDCVVRNVGGVTYMAVMIQNVGLSVFVMNEGFIVE